MLPRATLSTFAIITLGLLAYSATIAAEPAATKTEPGLVVRVFDTGVDVAAIPELMPDQQPNWAQVVPTLDLQTARKDFGPCTERFVTEVIGTLTLDQPGTYMLRLLSDDGGKLWLDGKVVVDHDGLHPADPKDSKPLELAAGPHELHIWHFQGGGDGQLTLQWKKGSRDQGSEGASKKDDKTAGDAAFEVIPAKCLSHAADISLRTTDGKKKIIPPLRRGRPGDGTPVVGAHPGLQHDDKVSGVDLPSEALRIVAGFLLAPTAQAGHGRPLAWVPDATQDTAIYETGQTVLADCPGEAKRIAIETITDTRQACALRHGPLPEQPWNWSDRSPFEMLAVHALANGFEIEFTKPLDPRVGWDPETYYVEQWPFDLEKGQAPHRDGIAYPVKSASVSADRKKVFLEIENLKASHVVYLRLLPPCLSAEGELPWSTEAWYTLNVIPTDRKGEVLTPPKPEPQNILTADEQAAGWRLLFDGQTLKGWHGYKKDAAPAGWQVKGGCIVRITGGGDIVTDEQFGDFELSLEWRISAAGNSGIMYRVTEDHGAPYETGPEYQILDNTEHADGKNPKTSASACYALYAPSKDATGPVGLFNQARIVVKGNHVEHWLNGVKVVSYDLHSPEWDGLVQDSKFKAWPDFGQRAKGHLVLQDHGDRVWYRNIKIKSGD